ncbi:MAG: sigma-70 family RNA polymerase sigma factor [Ruminococcaceae bacterium]|nr:sigma-70 family RNA polymerase sigma factor [Oscillospiraceae bacterium]
MEQRYIDALTNEYMSRIYYFCLKKTGNSIEAENLTSDILVNVLSSLNRGNIPVNFRGWVWQIARNRYCLWAAKSTQKQAGSSTRI